MTTPTVSRQAISPETHDLIQQAVREERARCVQICTDAALQAHGSVDDYSFGYGSAAEFCAREIERS